MIETISFFIFIMTIVNYYVHKDYRYPPFIFSFTWFAILASFSIVKRMDLIEINTITNLSLFVFSGGVFFFSLGGLTKSLSKRKQRCKKSTIPIGVTINKFWDNLFFMVPILFLPLYILKAIEISRSSGMGNFFIGLRWGLNYGEQSYGYLKYFIVIAVFNSLYRMLIISKFKKIHSKYKFKTYIALLIALIYSVLTTGRTGILFLFISLLGIAAINKSLSIKKVTISIGAFLTIFFLYAIFLNKGGSTDNSLLLNLVTVNEVILGYVYGALPAFDVFIHKPYEILYGQNTFRLFYVLFNSLSVIESQPVELVQEFVNVPFKTNVYTIYRYYIEDYGVIGAFTVLYFLGYLVSSLFSKVNRNIPSQLLYVILLYPIIFSFFQDQFFSLLSMWIQFFLLTKITFKYIIKIKNQI